MKKKLSFTWRFFFVLEQNFSLQYILTFIHLTKTFKFWVNIKFKSAFKDIEFIWNLKMKVPQKNLILHSGLAETNPPWQQSRRCSMHCRTCIWHRSNSNWRPITSLHNARLQSRYLVRCGSSLRMRLTFRMTPISTDLPCPCRLHRSRNRNVVALEKNKN